jgi:hypothetical protein
MSTIVLVPVKTESETNMRQRWQVRHARRKLQRASTTMVMRCAKGLPPLPVTVTLTRIAPRVLDGDNLQSSMKAIRDGVADFYTVDDADPRFTWQYRQVQGGVRQYAVEIDFAARKD